MPPRSREGKRVALLNLKQNRGTHVRSGAFTDPPRDEVAQIKQELEAGLRHDRKIPPDAPLPIMDSVRVRVLASKLAKLQRLEAQGSVDRWLRLAPNHSRVSSRIPGYVTAYLQLTESILSLAGELGLPMKEQARLVGSQAGGFRNLGDLVRLANEPVKVVVRYVDEWRDGYTPPDVPPASSEALPDGTSAAVGDDREVSRSAELSAPAAEGTGAIPDAPRVPADGDRLLEQIVGIPDPPADAPPQDEDTGPRRLGGWPWG